MNLSLANNNNLDDLSEYYQKYGYVKLANALENATAEEIASHIDIQEQWNLVFNHKGTHHDLNNIEVAEWDLNKKNDLLAIVNQQASAGFQYFYETIPIYDIYYKNLMPGHFFNDILEFLNTEKTLNLFRELLSAPEITFADGQITRFKAGHFLNCHKDDVDNKNRVAAFVINLTKDWRADWGGALHILNDELQIEQSFLPTFNEIHIFKIPVDHYVGYIPPFATGNRISITGWLRSGENPMTK
jgi:Rps23 Pro-64 3,4-dihydroxylase Tpa1-like proline 4-hydroxylase